MLGARLRAYPAVTDVKNADRISERPAPASAHAGCWRWR